MRQLAGKTRHGGLVMHRHPRHREVGVSGMAKRNYEAGAGRIGGTAAKAHRVVTDPGVVLVETCLDRAAPAVSQAQHPDTAVRGKCFDLRVEADLEGLVLVTFPERGQLFITRHFIRAGSRGQDNQGSVGAEHLRHRRWNLAVVQPAHEVELGIDGHAQWLTGHIDREVLLLAGHLDQLGHCLPGGIDGDRHQ